MKLQLLGTFRLTSGSSGADVTPRFKKTRALLAFLALSRETTATRESVARLLWSDRSPEQARSSLRQCLYDVKESVGSAADVLQTDRASVGFIPAKWDVDLLRLEELEPEAALEPLGGLDGCDPAYDAWLHTERDKRRREVLGVLESRLAKDLSARDRGRIQDAIRRLAPGSPVAAASATAPTFVAERLTSAPPSVSVSLGMAIGPGAADYAESVAWRLTAALTRVRWLYLVTADAGGAPAAPAREELAIVRPTARYDVRIAARVGGGGTQLGIELIDTAARRVVWSEMLDTRGAAEMSDDEIARAVAVIESRIRLHEIRRIAARSEASLGPDELVHRAVFRLAGLTRPDIGEAQRLLARALDLDPDSGQAHAYEAFAESFRVGQAFASDPRSGKERARLHARRATELAPDDAWAWAVRGHIEAFLFRRAHDALPYFERALRLDPSAHLVWTLSALDRCYLGDIEGALRHSERARQLSEASGAWLGVQVSMVSANASAVAGDYDSAERLARSVVHENPGFLAAYPPLLASLAARGKIAEAERYAALLREGLPDLSIAALAELFPLVQLVPRFAQAIELAGVER